jgi:hypothetical protein
VGSIPIARSQTGRVQVPRPPALGDQNVVNRLRSVLFSEPILGATAVQPKGYWKVILAGFLGWAGPIIAKRATEPLPPTYLYLAVTPIDVRLFSKSPWTDLFEIGRWKKGSYRASANGGRLEMDVESMGRITLLGPSAPPVFEMVVQGAAGPAAPQ